MKTTKLNESAHRPKSIASCLQEIWDAVNYPEIHTAWTWALFFAVLALVPGAFIFVARLTQSIIALIN